MRAIPILQLHDGDITSLFYDSERDVLLIGVSDGRIIRMRAFASSAYMTGERSILAQAKDGFGNESAVD